MPEMIINTKTLPESLYRLIHADKVKVYQTGDEIRMIPISESPETDQFLAIKHASADAEEKMRRLYELCGSGADLKMTVESFLAMTHDEKEL